MTWLDVRKTLRDNRFALGLQAATRYPDLPTLPGSTLLTRPDWVPARPVPLSAITLSLGASPPVPALPGGDYAATMAALDPPAVFENRATYRLLAADLTGTPRLAFGHGTYFDHIDTGEAAAHELAAGGPTPLRDAVGDPRDLTRRPANLAISVLTVRRGPIPTFFLHWRDPARVGHAGGLHQVLPVGVFQAAGDDRDDVDFSLWRCIVREYAEEFLGEAELSDVDYESWPFHNDLTEARRNGGIRAECVGLGVDPLTFATDLLVRVEFSPEVFDELLGAWVRDNDEGAVSEVPLTANSAAGLTLQPAGAAILTWAGCTGR